MSVFSVSKLQQRSKLLHNLRSFFFERGVMEVDVPVIGAHTVTDVFLEPLTTIISQQQYFLQTSPEYYLKRLLAEGSGCIFYLGKAFRRDEKGKKHRPEFTMLEWYRIGFDDRALMTEIEDLFFRLVPSVGIKRCSYGSVFESVLGCCPHTATKKELHALALSSTSFIGELEYKSAYLDLLFSYCVEPELGEDITLVFDYPVEQAALAKVCADDDYGIVARRFEVFWGGVELANGYWELTDADEQRRRFDRDLAMRQQMGLATPEVDKQFLAALDKGLPECAGVALGVDRLLMCMLNCENIAEVMPFADC